MAAISNDWLAPLSGEFKKPYYKKLYETVKHEYETREIFPAPDDIFNAFAFTPLEKVKVVILGQDPYHNNGQAHGLSFSVKPDIDVELLTPNEYSRPGIATNKITGIVVHYTANPGATAMNNRDYFEGLKDSHITKASSNFVVGLEGEIVQCVPTWEIAYASNSRNIDTVSIECCHPDETGIFNKKTYQSMVDLCAWLCLKFDLDENDVIRHYDVTGKICPKYFVENEDAWRKFKSDIGTKLKKLEEYQ